MLQSVSYPVFIYKQATAPELIAGSIWYKTDTEEYFTCDGIAWSEMTQDSLLTPMLENSLDILAIQAAETLAGGQAADMIRDLFSDSTGYLNTIDLGNTTAYFTTDKYDNSSSVGIISTMTTDNAPSPLVASANTFTGGFNPFKAFDNNDGTTWYISGTHTGWLKIDLGAGNAATAKRFYIKSFDTNSSPKDYTIQGSNNDAAWTTIKTITNQADTFEGFVDLTNSTAYRYYKMDITAAYGNDLGCNKLQFYTSSYTNKILRTNMQTLSSTPVKCQIFAHKTTFTTTGNINASVSFDNGAHYQNASLDEVQDITNTGTQLILKLNLNAGASDGSAECKGYGVLFW